MGGLKVNNYEKRWEYYALDGLGTCRFTPDDLQEVVYSLK
jgi:hypothetical protein